MIDNKVFNENLDLLEKLFPHEFSDSLIEEKLRIFNATELDWEKNSSRFTNKEIRYLLICESPPNNGDYFYTNFKKALFNKVWETFFETPKCNNADEAYKKLADIGFLLIDTLPYSMDYSTDKKRYLPEYELLVNKCLVWWQQKLDDNFIINDKTIIAFGFKLNAEKIIEVTKGELKHNNYTFTLSDKNLVADRKERWQPSVDKLKYVFNQ